MEFSLNSYLKFIHSNSNRIQRHPKIYLNFCKDPLEKESSYTDLLSEYCAHGRLIHF